MAKNHLAALLLAIAIGSGLTLAACVPGSGASSGTGGKSGSGGSGGSGGSPGTGGSGTSCSNVSACGGDLVGTWTVTSSCLKVTGTLDLSLVGASCPTAPVTGDLQVTGTWTANSDGTYSDDTTTTGTEQFTLASSCLVISSTPVTCDGAAGLIQTLGYASVDCASAASGGCSCSATVHQTGGLGVVSDRAGRRTATTDRLRQHGHDRGRRRATRRTRTASPGTSCR